MIRASDTVKSARNRFLKLFGLVVFLAINLFVVSDVSRVAMAYSESGIQGYAAESILDSGTIVQSSEDAGDKQPVKVKVASQDEIQKMFGVVVDPSRLSVTLSTGLENEAFVATTGTHHVLVSTQGGAIAAGDYLMLSAIKGVATKADTQEVTVFGRATVPFDGKGVTLGTTTIKDTDGNVTETVALGSIPVTIDIRQNPNKKSTKTKAPEFLERIGEAIAEKEVSPIRMYISMGITAVSLVTALIVIYAGVRNGMISIGRNPMSKKSIFRALFEIILTSALILIIGLFAVYLLLKL